MTEIKVLNNTILDDIPVIDVSMSNAIYRGPKGDKGDKGDDGFIQFEELTPEQKEELRGPQGIQGPQGKTGPQGPQGIQGKPGADYVLTEADKNEIAEITATLVPSGGGASNAIDVSFDDTVAQIGVDNIQEAIEYLADSGITSEVVQEQIDANRSWDNATLMDVITGNVPFGIKTLYSYSAEDLFNNLKNYGITAWEISSNKPTLKQYYDEGYMYLLTCDRDGIISRDYILDQNSDDTLYWEKPSAGGNIYVWGNALIYSHSRIYLRKALTDNIFYDNSNSGLNARTIKGAIDELADRESGGGGLTEEEINILIDNKLSLIVDGNEVNY